MDMTPRVFTIPASAPFLPTLIEALGAGKLGFAMSPDPLALTFADVVDGFAGVELSRVDTNEAELTDERIGHDLKYER